MALILTLPEILVSLYPSFIAETSFKNCEGFEILPNLQGSELACRETETKIHGCWEKTQDFQFRDKELYFSWQYQ